MRRTAGSIFNRQSRTYAALGSILLLGSAFVTAAAAGGGAQAQGDAKALAETPSAGMELVEQYCSACHNDSVKQGGVSFASLKASDLETGANADIWEKMLRKVEMGEMPPRNAPHPAADKMAGFTRWVTTARLRYAAANPDPGNPVLRRMNRAEYANAVRDLLSYDIDVSGELPADDASYGFDNIADALTISPTLMDRYVAVAGKVSRTATGLSSQKPFTTFYIVPKDGSLKNVGKPAYNERASEDLPLDSRGGGAFKYYAPYDGVYEIRAYLNANTNTELDLLPENLVKVRTPMKAGAHIVGMSFPREAGLDERPQIVRNTTNIVIIPQAVAELLPLNVQVDGQLVATVPVKSFEISNRFSQNNFPRDVQQIEVEGPFTIAAPVVDTRSRRKIFTCTPSATLSEKDCATSIVKTVAHRAFRRPVTDTDIKTLMKVYDVVREDQDFEHGVAGAIQAILVSPQFLFLQEQVPAGKAGTLARVTDLELASRLSFFLWSSIPDDELLTIAEKNQLSDPQVLKTQVARMMRDPKAMALTKNFAAQWLYLRSLEVAKPDLVTYPTFDVRLRSAMKTETEMFFASVVRENDSILNFLDSDYTYLNQRLAQHYGVEGVQGTSFRKVKLDKAVNRGGLLGQGSILTVTSHSNTTSAVKRGQWILENLLAAAPPPPPPNIPALVHEKAGRQLSAREQMEMHRASPACAGCHMMMDPLGLALENYDAIGAWRDKDSSGLINAVSVMPNGKEANGPDGLRQLLLAQQDQFASAFTQRLMTYAMGRGVKAQDLPIARSIAAKAKTEDYRINSIVMGIVTSDPFVMKRTSGQ